MTPKEIIESKRSRLSLFTEWTIGRAINGFVKTSLIFYTSLPLLIWLVNDKWLSDYKKVIFITPSVLILCGYVVIESVIVNYNKFFNVKISKSYRSERRED